MQNYGGNVMLIKKLLYLATFAVLLGPLGCPLFGQAPAKAPVAFSEKDREFALKYLNETRDDFVKQLTGLSQAQMNFRAAEGRWTIAEIAEHITVVESALFGMITNQVMRNPPPKCDDPFRIADTAVVLTVTNRSQKFSAPEQLRPTGRWKTRDELLASFDKTRGQTIDFFKNNKADLRSTFGQGPMGTLDSYQWFLYAIGHSDRHLAQLKEVKADPNFPKK
jgi:hypothetical protein